MTTSSPNNETSQTIDGPTPNGGVRSTAYFFDADNKPVSKANAVKVEIVEFDKDGNAIHRTYGTTAQGA